MYKRDIGFVLGFLLSIAVLEGAVVSYATAAAPAKETLTTHTQNWDRSLPSSSRFTVLSEFENMAVRDNNTGLVWEKEPNLDFSATYDGARQRCITAEIGGARGWRLPSIVELMSLQDPSLLTAVPESIFGPAAQGGRYWSATSDAAWPTNAWAAVLGPPFAIPFSKDDPNSRVWCVRGPMQESVYWSFFKSSNRSWDAWAVSLWHPSGYLTLRREIVEDISCPTWLIGSSPALDSPVSDLADSPVFTDGELPLD